MSADIGAEVRLTRTEADRAARGRGLGRLLVDVIEHISMRKEFT